MRFHDAPGMNAILKERAIFRKIFEEFLLFVFVLKGRIARIGPGDHMIKAKREIDSFWSSHKKIIPKRKDPCQ